MADHADRSADPTNDAEAAAVFVRSEWRSLSDWRIMQTVRVLFVELNDRGSRVRQTIPRDSEFVDDVSEHQRVVNTSDLVASERFPMWITADYVELQDREEAHRKITVQEASALIGLSTRALWSRIRRATQRGEVTPFVREGVRGRFAAQKQDVIAWQQSWVDGRTTRHVRKPAPPKSHGS
ncbi:MAG: hypothetical protein ABGY41_19540 [Candidatus Poribacteria bacterium]